MDDERAPDSTQADRAAPDEPGSLYVPQMTQAAGAPEPPAPKPADGLSGTDALAADITAAWNGLDALSRLLINGSAAALILVVIGLPLSVWDSATFALLVVTAAVFTIVTGWFGASPTARSMPIPVSTIELVAALVAAVLGIMKVIEVVFDLDSDGIVGIVFSVALAIATVVMVVAVVRRGADPLGALTSGDQGTKIAAAGLAIVLVGWAINLTIGFWTMNAAALPLAVLVIAALTVLEAPRINSPIPVAWVGAGIAVFGALLAIGHWGDFSRLGRTEVTLDVVDYLGFFGYALGAVVIIVGAALSGRDVWASRQPAAATTAPSAATTPPEPTAPWVPAPTAPWVPAPTADSPAEAALDSPADDEDRGEPTA